MPGKTLDVVGIGTQAAEMGRAIGGDVDVAAPGVVHADVGELWEHRADSPPEHTRGIERIDARVTHPPAEQQARVLEHAEIIEDPVHVGDRRAVTDQARGTFAQRLGGHDVRADGQELARELWYEAAEQCSPGDQQMRGLHAAFRGVDHVVAGGVLRDVQTQHARSFEECYAGLGRRPSEPEGVPVGVQVAAVRVVQPAGVPLAREDAAQLVALDETQ
jgi:hypothetical protein